MGSSLPPFFAVVVMRDTENSYLKKLPFKHIAYYKYVDDIFCDKLDELLFVFNNDCSNIKIIRELEKDCQLNILEMSIFCQKHCLTFNWFHKSTNSGSL